MPRVRSNKNNTSNNNGNFNVTAYQWNPYGQNTPPPTTESTVSSNSSSNGSDDSGKNITEVPSSYFSPNHRERLAAAKGQAPQTSFLVHPQQFPSSRQHPHMLAHQKKRNSVSTLSDCSDQPGITPQDNQEAFGSISSPPECAMLAGSGTYNAHVPFPSQAAYGPSYTYYQHQANTINNMQLAPSPIVVPATRRRSFQPQPIMQQQQPAAPQQQQQQVRNQLSFLPPHDLLRVLRAQPNDNLVAVKCQELSPEALLGLLDTLVMCPDTVQDLCKLDRGNIVVHLFQICTRATAVDLYASRLNALFGVLAKSFLDLSTNKLGALALTRLHEALHPANVFRLQLDTLILQHFDQIICHPFGNFLVSQLIKCLSTAADAIKQPLVGIFCDPVQLTRICLDKFGSHTAEVWANHAPEDAFCDSLVKLVLEKGSVAMLANSLIGNNPLQQMILRMYPAREVQDQNSRLAHTWKGTSRKIRNAIEGCKYRGMVTAALHGRGRPGQH